MKERRLSEEAGSAFFFLGPVPGPLGEIGRLPATSRAKPAGASRPLGVLRGTAWEGHSGTGASGALELIPFCGVLPAVGGGFPDAEVEAALPGRVPSTHDRSR